MLKFEHEPTHLPNLYWEISQKNYMNWSKPCLNSLQNSIITTSQIIGFVYKSLPKLLKMSNKTWEKLC